MDYDNDGMMDMVSGSYDPGDIYLFRGLGNGEYAKRELLKDENDIPLVHHPTEMAKYLGYTKNKENKNEGDSDEATQWRVASFGSWIAMTDWDDDGDLDALIGSFSGSLFLRTNIGSREEPVFSGDSQQIKLNGELFKVHCHASPAIADWDGDGLWDMVVGAGDGSVAWYKNVGELGSPKFENRLELIAPKSTDKFLSQKLAPGEEPKPAVRAQICVTDYNLDGKLDLLVGDFSEQKVPRELSEEESVEQKKCVAKQEKLAEQITTISAKIYPRTEEAIKALEELDEDEVKEMQAEYQKLVQEYVNNQDAERKFYAKNGPASHIWYYERAK